MQMTSTRRRVVMGAIAVVLVGTVVSIAANLSQDDRGALGTIGLWLQVVGVVGMVIGLGFLARERRRE